MATEADRAAWISADQLVDKLEAERDALLAPTKERYYAAQEARALIEERTGEPQGTCEACAQPMFKGEPWLPGETPLCGICAPTYAELLSSPESFVNADDEPMTAEEARQIYDNHIAAGGKPEDSMARVTE